MSYTRVQQMADAMCTKCGAIFRARAHSVTCANELDDQRVLDLSHEMQEQQIVDDLQRRLQKLKAE